MEDLNLNSLLQTNDSPLVGTNATTAFEFKTDNVANVITTSRIQDLAITSAKIGSAAIGNAQMGTAVIGTAQIGTLSFNQISGGTAVLGGTSNGNGLLSVKNNLGSEVVRADSTGLTVTNGSIIIQNSAGSNVLDSTGIVSTTNFASDSVTASAETKRNNNAYADLDSMTLTTPSFTRDTKVFSLFTCNNRPANLTNASDYTQYMLNIDGTNQTQMPAYNLQYEGASGYANLLSTSIQLMSTLGTGTHIIKAVWRTGGVGDASTFDRVLTYLVLGK